MINSPFQNKEQNSDYSIKDNKTARDIYIYMYIYQTSSSYFTKKVKFSWPKEFYIKNEIIKIV